MANIESVKSAIVIVPPLEKCRHIQEIRNTDTNVPSPPTQELDGSQSDDMDEDDDETANTSASCLFSRKSDDTYHRWMPHIKLVYPFYMEHSTVFRREALRLTKSLSMIKPFTVTFNKDSLAKFCIGHSRFEIGIKPVMTNLPLNEKPSLAKKRGVSLPAKPTKKQNSPSPGEKVSLAPARTLPKPGPLKNWVEEPHDISIGLPNQLPPTTVRLTSACGLASLSDAIWTPENTWQEIEIAKEICHVDSFAALRFAFYGIDDEASPASDQSSLNMREFGYAMTDRPTKCDMGNNGSLIQTCISIETRCTDAESGLQETSPPICSFDSDETSDAESACEAKEATEAMAGNEDDTISMCEEGQRNHQEGLVALQEALSQAYPDLTHLILQSNPGFQPHLTLGQSDFHGSQLLMTDIAKSFTEFSFLVDKIQIISCNSLLDPFKVKISIPLGANVC